MEEVTKEAKYTGKSHAEGGIPAVVAETGKKVEIEADEYKLCSDAVESTEVLNFKNKTNEEILKSIHQKHSCKFDQNIVHASEFIICKVAVRDKQRRDRNGTVKSILNQIQSEKSCNVMSSGGQVMELGGGTTPTDQSSKLKEINTAIKADPKNKLLQTRKRIIEKMAAGGKVKGAAKNGAIQNVKMYHGSPTKDIIDFEFKHGVRSTPMMGRVKERETASIFFTPDKAVAEFFAQNRVDYYDSIGKKGDPTIYERYITINHPADFTTVESAEDILEKTGINVEEEILGTISPYKVYLNNLIEGRDLELSDLWQIADKKDLVDKLKAAGYDGAIFWETGERGKSYAIFDPTQATKNKSDSANTLSTRKADTNRQIGFHKSSDIIEDKPSNRTSDDSEQMGADFKEPVPHLSDKGSKINDKFKKGGEIEDCGCPHSMEDGGAVESKPKKPKSASLMTLQEYQQTVTPILQEYNKFIKKNEQYLASISYGGIYRYTFEEALENIENGTAEANTRNHFRRSEYDKHLSAEDYARKEWGYRKTGSYNAGFEPKPTPDALLEKKNDYIVRLRTFFTEEEILWFIEKDEVKSNKRAVKRAIDNDTYKKWLANGTVTIHELENVAKSVGVNLPKKIFSETTIKENENKALYDKIYASMPNANRQVLSRLVDDIKETFKPLEEIIYKKEVERYESLIAKYLNANKAKYPQPQSEIEFSNDIFNYAKREERKFKTYSRKWNRDIDSVEHWVIGISLKGGTKEVVSRYVRNYIESLKAKMIYSIIDNFRKITLPIKEIKQLELRVGAKGFQGEYKFTFENGSSFVFKTEAIGAGGYNIQIYHFRYLTHFTNVKLADGADGDLWWMKHFSSEIGGNKMETGGLITGETELYNQAIGNVLAQYQINDLNIQYIQKPMVVKVFNNKFDIDNIKQKPRGVIIPQEWVTDKFMNSLNGSLLKTNNEIYTVDIPTKEYLAIRQISNDVYDKIRPLSMSYASGGKVDSDQFSHSEKKNNFVQNITKDGLQHILSGAGEVRHGAAIQAASLYLSSNEGSGSENKGSKRFKEQEAERLKEYINQNKLWTSVADSKYVSEGAEQKVYFTDKKHVIKTNDAIFYGSWAEYLNSLLLHNFFFPDTAYELIGFVEKDNRLLSVVKQPFVEETEKTDLEFVKKFLAANGFENTRNNDYYNPALGIVLEDLHDENVLTENGVLQFIDTVFYIREGYKKMKDGGSIHGTVYKTITDSDGTKWDAVSSNKSGIGKFDIYRNEAKQESGADKATDIESVIDMLRDDQKSAADFKKVSKIHIADLSFFEPIIKESSSADEAFAKASKIHNVPPAVATAFMEKYGEGKNKSPKEAFTDFYNDVKGHGKEEGRSERYTIHFGEDGYIVRDADTGTIVFKGKDATGADAKKFAYEKNNSIAKADLSPLKSKFQKLNNLLSGLPTLSMSEQKFIDSIKQQINDGKKFNKTTIEREGELLNLRPQTYIKELVELAIVMSVREIVQEGGSTKQIFDKIVDLYEGHPNLSHRDSESIKLAQYSTSVPLSFCMAQYIKRERGAYLEPSAGNGSLVASLPAKDCVVNEIDDIRRRNLQQQGFKEVLSQDATEPFKNFQHHFSGVISNPPFGSLDYPVYYDGYELKSLEHLMVARALDCMKSDGRGSFIIGGHQEHDEEGRIRKGAQRVFMAWLFRTYNVDDVVNINGQALYSKQGTGINLRVILVNGRKPTPEGFPPLLNRDLTAEDQFSAAPVSDWETLYKRIMQYI